jgi:methylmalonyl-CoA mutase N-terminal domain/subunit
MNETVFRPALAPDARERLEAQVRGWEEGEVARFIAKEPERQVEFNTLGGFPVKRTYTALDIVDTPLEDIGLPGQYPYTRGPYPTMYRGRIWTMRQIAGFGTADDTNARFKYLIANGQTGLSTDFDMPTLMGYDSDHPMCDGEVGREGVAIDTLADMARLFDGIDLTKILSMTINLSAWILLAMYVALAKKRGYDLNALSGTIQADILKEYQAQKEWIYPIAPSVRIVRDCITYCAQHMKRYNPINISGYHISEAGSSPLDEVAFTMCNLIAYVEEVQKTGMQVDEFAPRLAFYDVCQVDFFEEIAKLRSARRVYAKLMRERFGARTGVDATALPLPDGRGIADRPQYEINVVRTGLQALAAVSAARRVSIRMAWMRLRDPHRGSDADRAANAADHRRRIRRCRRRRPAWRLVLRRKPDHPVRAGDICRDRRGRSPGGHPEAHRGRLVPASHCRFCL